jgi:hypothetical protein
MADMPQPSPSFLEILQQFPGLLKNKLGQAIGSVGPQESPDYNLAYSRLSHDPMIMANSSQQMKQLDPNDWGATFQKPGDVGIGGGPLAQLVRSQLPSGPVSVVSPDATSTMEQPKQGGMQGVPRHEAIHQFLGDSHVSADSLLSQLPQPVADQMRSYLTQNVPKSQWANEIAARLGSSGINAPGSDPRINQAETLGISPQQAQQAWSKYLSLLAKTDPAKAAKLMRYTGANQPSNSQYLASIATQPK